MLKILLKNVHFQIILKDHHFQSNCTDDILESRL